MMDLELNAQHQCVYKLTYHLVLVTKYRKKCFTDVMLTRLHLIVKELCQKWGIQLLSFHGEPDYVHLLLDLHPNIVPSRLVNQLKNVTNRLIRKEFANHLAQYYWQPVLWARSYCLLTHGDVQTVDIIRHYLERQEDFD